LLSIHCTHEYVPKRVALDALRTVTSLRNTVKSPPRIKIVIPELRCGATSGFDLELRSY
jgi:hypothetical protein